MSLPERRKIMSFGFSSEDSRKKRETHTTSLRKKERDERLTKRRTAPSQAQPQSHPVNSAEAIPFNLKKLRSQDFNQILEAAEAFRRMLSYEQNPPIYEVIESGVVMDLIECLSHNDEKLQYEALWCLTNIASGTHENTLELIRLDVIPKFLHFFNSPSAKIREQACWAIGNIAGDCTEFRDIVLEKNGMEAVLNLLQTNAAIMNPHTTNIQVIRVATWTLSNLCRGKPHPDFNTIRSAIPVVTNILQIYEHDKDVTIDALWTFSFLSDGDDEKQTAIAEQDINHLFIKYLSKDELEFQLPALRIIGNLLSGPNETTQMVLDVGALPVLKNMLLHQKHGIRKEACWSISNVVAGTEHQIQQVISLDFFPILVQLLMADKFDVKKEAAWCLANAVSGANRKQIGYFVTNGLVPILCQLLDFNDLGLIKMTLDAIERTLKVGEKIRKSQNEEKNQVAKMILECQGLERIERITQQDHDEEIFQKASKILNDFFVEKEYNESEDYDGQSEYEFKIEDQDTPYNI